MSVMMIRFIVVLSLLVNVACQLKAKAFQAADEEGYPVPSDFPEMEILASKNKPNTAVGFSGGGSRAYTCAVGQLAGLHSLGLIPNIKYLGGVSGGSWAIGAFSYAQNSNSDDELLGPIIPPAKITMDALNLMDQNCMRAVTNTGFPTAIMKWCWHTKSNPVSNFADAWHGAVQSIYFDPRGISAKVRYSYDESTVADIKSRNPDLENAKFFTLANSDRPYPIVTSTLIGPHAGASYQNTTFNFTRIEFTPLYTGDLAHWNVTYHYDNGQVHEYQYGGAIESFAFPIGSSEAPDVGLEVDEKEGSLAVPAPAEIPDVAYGPAVGSFAPGSIMSTVSFINDQTSWDGNYWSPSDPNPVARSYDWADAGVLENMPLLSFVQRGVEKIVIFDNCVTGLHMADVFNPETDQMVTGMIDEAFAAYFGWYPPYGKDAMFDSRAYERRVFQIFAQEDYAGVVEQLQKAQADGGSPIASFELTTVENKVWRIKAGHKIKIIFAYLGRSTTWESQLPEDIRKQVVPETDPENLANVIDSGDFKDFPHYSTSGAELSYKQSNLLASYVGWVVQEHAEMFKEILS